MFDLQEDSSNIFIPLAKKQFSLYNKNDSKSIFFLKFELIFEIIIKSANLIGKYFVILNGRGNGSTFPIR